eukprot:CAMPEP_0180418804 /NCGR_PEP_ID=MMETSP1036_2-20121128/1756_1 /TAXON_ID=632150 /ORGANISM="Azadinium spinosum, Strain 3D9" /LENGTH=41 /DNA_ID= /DNA_START= /DNA_END= /DNA_ORIENTATION=
MTTRRRYEAGKKLGGACHLLKSPLCSIRSSQPERDHDAQKL